MRRLLLDTCAIIDLMTDSDSLDRGFWDIVDDPENLLYISADSDHIIISHAITERMTLISSDTKFPFYRNQGLELIEY